MPVAVDPGAVGLARAAALVDAVDAPEAPLAERLEALLRLVCADLDASGAAVELVLGEGAPRAVVASHGALPPSGAAASAGRVPLGGGADLVVAPAAALDRDRGLVDLAARLVRRALDRARLEQRVRRAEDAVSAITHDMNNALTPLLCHGSEAVGRDALRLRSLLDTLRQVRGRARPRELWWIPAWMERSRKLLSLAGSGAYTVTLACDEEARGLTIGPEQERLLPEFLGVGYALRARAPAGSALALRARVEGGRVVVEVEGPSPLDALVGVVEPDGPAPVAHVRVARSAAGTGTCVGFRLVRRPRVVVIEGPTVAPARLVHALEALGLDVDRGGGVDALARVIEAPEPAAVLVLHDAHSEGGALRLALHRAQPTLAARCLFLDELQVPRHHRPSPDEVDLAEVLARGGPA